MSEEQNQVEVPVNQTAPILEHTHIDLLSDMRSRAQMMASLAKRIFLTRDIAQFSLAFCSMRRGYDLSLTLGSQIVKPPNCRGLVFNFQFVKTFRASLEAVVVLADGDCRRVVRSGQLRHTARSRNGWGGT